MTNYDSSKKYTWSPEDKFELSGRDFGLILNTLRAILTTEEAAKILLANQANQAIEAIMANGVESGKIIEVGEPIVT